MKMSANRLSFLSLALKVLDPFILPIAFFYQKQEDQTNHLSPECAGLSVSIVSNKNEPNVRRVYIS